MSRLISPIAPTVYGLHPEFVERHPASDPFAAHTPPRSTQQGALRNAIAATCLLCICATATAAATSASDGTVVNNNTGYLKQPSTAGSPITVFQNGAVGVGLGLYYPHSTIIASNGVITDTQFSSLLSTNLVNNGTWTQDSLDIHMAQCFSGGFIDELDDGGVQNVSINTGAWWGSPSFGSAAAAGHNFYSDAWYNGLISSTINGKPYKYNQTQLVAYTKGDANDQTHKQELPQYYSTGAAMDNDIIGVSKTGNSLVGNEVALVFVGDDKNNGNVRLRHWNDAINYISYLQAQGYTNNNIYFYYVGGTAPAGGAALPGGMVIDGAATTANFNSFFNTTVKNSSGQVAVWTADHGGLQNTFKGVAQLKLTPTNKGNVTIGFQLGSNLTNFVNQPEGGADLQITTNGITGATANDKLDVLITDSHGDSYDLGNITFDGNPDSFDLAIPTADLLQMDQTELGLGDTLGEAYIEFANYNILADPNPNDTGNAAFSGDYSNVNLDNISLNFGAQQIESVPEPGTLLLAGVPVAGLLLRRRKAARVHAA